MLCSDLNSNLALARVKTFHFTTECSILVLLRLFNQLQVKVLEGEVLVRLRLEVRRLLNPCHLEHLLKHGDSLLILFQLLEKFTHA